jgi:hypothetical protein
MTLNGVYELEKRRKVGTDLGFPVEPKQPLLLFILPE